MSHHTSPPTPRRATRRGLIGRRSRALALLAGAMFGLLALGATPAFAIQGTVSGTFTVPAGTHSPSDVTVELVSPYDPYYDEYRISATTVSATSGSYTIGSNVNPGEYYVYFIDGTTGDNVQADFYGDGGSDVIQQGSLVTVKAAATTTVPSVALHAGATISGTVSDANRSSESEAYVSVYPIYPGVVSDPLLNDGDVEVPVSTTNGTWSAGGLPPGTYYLSYYAEGSLAGGVTLEIDDAYDAGGALTFDYGNATRFTVAGSSSQTANFSVPAVGVISGTVTSPAGPLYDDEVNAVDGIGEDGGYGYTAVDGNYSMTVLPGTYKIQFGALPTDSVAGGWYGGSDEAQASSVTVAAGQTVSNVNETFTAPGTITGTVVSAQGGAPVGGLEVDLLDAQGNYVQDDLYTATQLDGTFTIPDVPPGTWYVRVDSGRALGGTYYASQYYGGTAGPYGALPITVAAGQTVTGINEALLPYSLAPLGMPTETAAALSGLHDNKVALAFKLAAGTGAGYLKTVTVGLPNGFSWDTAKLASTLSLGSGIAFTEAVSGRNLSLTLASGQPSVAFVLSAGGITVDKAVEKAAGGLSAKKPKKHKKKHHDAAAAKAKKKKKKPTKAKDTIKSELVNLSVADTTGQVTSLPITIAHPH